MKKITLLVMLLTVVSKIFGFLRISIVNSLFGSGPVSNVFTSTFEFPTTIMSLVAISIILSMIPNYSVIEKQSQRRAELYISNLFNIVVLFSFIVSLFVFLFPGFTVNLFYDFQTPYEIELATLFIRIIAFGSFCLAITNMMNGYLNLKDSFIIPASVSVLLNLVVISGVYFASVYHVTIMPIAIFSGFLLESLVAFYFAAKKGFRLRKLLRFRLSSVKKTFRMSIPIMFNTWISQLSLSARRYVGTGIGTSAMVYFNSAFIIGASIQGIFATSILNVMYPTLSRQAANLNLLGVKKTMRDLIIMMGILVIPITVGSMILSTPLMTLLYHRGAYSLSDVLSTSDIFFILSVSFFPLCIVDLMLQIFYALRNTKIPLQIEGFNLVILVVLLLVFVNLQGLNGLALAYVVSIIIKMILYLTLFIKRYGGIRFKSVLADLMKVILASLAMGVITYLSYEFLRLRVSNSISVLLSILLSIGFYFVVIVYSRIEAMDVLIKQLKESFQSNR